MSFRWPICSDQLLYFGEASLPVKQRVLTLTEWRTLLHEQQVLIVAKYVSIAVFEQWTLDLLNSTGAGWRSMIINLAKGSPSFIMVVLIRGAWTAFEICWAKEGCGFDEIVIEANIWGIGAWPVKAFIYGSGSSSIKAITLGVRALFAEPLHLNFLACPAEEIRLKIIVASRN